MMMAGLSLMKLPEEELRWKGRGTAAMGGTEQGGAQSSLLRLYRGRGGPGVDFSEGRGWGVDGHV